MFGWKSGDSRNRRKNSYTSWGRRKKDHLETPLTSVYCMF